MFRKGSILDGMNNLDGEGEQPSAMYADTDKKAFRSFMRRDSKQRDDSSMNRADKLMTVTMSKNMGSPIKGESLERV